MFLYDPRDNTIFYVDAGQKLRMYQHVKDAYQTLNGESMTRVEKIREFIYDLNRIKTDFDKVEKLIQNFVAPDGYSVLSGVLFQLPMRKRSR